MEEILKQILNEVKETKENQQHLSTEVKSLSTEVKSLSTEVKGLSSEVKEIKESQNHLNTRIDKLDANQLRIETKLENDIANKITALFDGYTLRGDQIERLQEHLDERLDAIQTDLSYVVSKVAQHDRSILHLNKVAK